MLEEPESLFDTCVGLPRYSTSLDPLESTSREFNTLMRTLEAPEVSILHLPTIKSNASIEPAPLKSIL